jgi:hypothetical protein
MRRGAFHADPCPQYRVARTVLAEDTVGLREGRQYHDRFKVRRRR